MRNLEKSFKNLHVLKGIDLSVDRGHIFALLGSNGAGKTTMIKILTTLIKPNGGQIKINGIDVLKEPDKVREEISLTGQNVAVDDILTGRENLLLIGKLRHLNHVKQKVQDLLSQFNLVDAADRKVFTYSGGMRRRLDLAMSLLGHPSIIFLDEPTTGLDPQSRIAMWDMIKTLAKSGITIFLTTQYLEEADQLADHIAILHEGKIVAEGSPDKLKKLLPHGHIELKFLDKNDITKAHELLHEYQIHQDETNQSLSITTDGSIAQITRILTLLENEAVKVSEFIQKPPSLDDVFLSIIGEKARLENRV